MFAGVLYTRQLSCASAALATTRFIPWAADLSLHTEATGRCHCTGQFIVNEWQGEMEANEGCQYG